MTKAAEAFTRAAILRRNRGDLALRGTLLKAAGSLARAGDSARTERAIVLGPLCAVQQDIESMPQIIHSALYVLLSSVFVKQISLSAQRAQTLTSRDERASAAQSFVGCRA
jgi:hypothetical protein